jgi:hypothetical protein
MSMKKNVNIRVSFHFLMEINIIIYSTFHKMFKKIGQPMLHKSRLFCICMLHKSCPYLYMYAASVISIQNLISFKILKHYSIFIVLFVPIHLYINHMFIVFTVIFYIILLYFCIIHFIY